MKWSLPVVALCGLAAIAALTVAYTGGPTKPEPVALSGEWVLVGTGCGPEGVVMVAREEDHFPAEGCAAIDVHWLED